MELSNLAIENILRDCLTEEDTENTLIITGIALQFKLDKIRLEEHREEITMFLDLIIPENETLNFRFLNINQNFEEWGTPFFSELLIIMAKGLDLIEIHINDNDLPYIKRKAKEKYKVFKKV